MSIKGPSEVTPAYIYESNIHVANILSTLNEQRKCGLLCDITIIVQGVELKAHKAILASCSSYFNRIITDPANVSHNIVLELSSISKVGMESLLEFAYTSKLAVTSSNIDEIICAAHELEFKNIEFSCLNYLKQQLISGAATSCFLNSSEASTLCGNSKISRKMESFGKTEENAPIKPVSKSEKGCPIMNKFSRCNKKKENAPPPYSCGMGDKKPDLCEQMSQEQHREMIKQILEKHGLEAASTDEKMDIGATDVQGTCQMPSAMSRQVMSTCRGMGMEKKHNPLEYGSNICSDTEGSGDEDGACSMARSQTGKLRKAPAIKLPFTMDEITSMPRAELHEVLTRNPNLTQEQICAIHEIRRRGKNRIAAQRCRKRKMECIRSLVAEIEVLRSEHSKLMSERRNAREQAQKLSDKFRVKCEKFFKCDKKKCKLRLGSCSTNAPAVTAPVPPEAEPLLGQNDTAVRNFHEHAEKAYQLCRRLKEAPCEDLPACTPIATSDCSMWANPCLSPPDNEVVVVCDGTGGDSSDAGSMFQAASPASSFNDSACAMSPSQRLSDIGNMYISPPGRPADTRCVTASGTSRTSVVLHTSSVENKGHLTQTLPPLNTITQGFNTFPTHTIASGGLPIAQIPPTTEGVPSAVTSMNLDFHPQ